MVECWKDSIIFAKIIISNLFNIINMFSTGKHEPVAAGSCFLNMILQRQVTSSSYGRKSGPYRVGWSLQRNKGNDKSTD